MHKLQYVAFALVLVLGATGLAESALAALTTLDTTTPTVGPIAGTSTTLNTNQTITVTYADSVGVTGCTLYINGVSKGAMSLSGTTSGTASMGANFGNEGTYSVYATCMDTADNVATSATTTVIVSSAVDTTKPSVGAVVASTNTTVNVAQNVIVNYSDAIGVTSCNLYVNGVNRGAMSISDSTSGVASLNLTLSSAGNYQLYASCKDAAGNIAVGATTTIATTGLATNNTPASISTFTLGQLTADAQMIAMADFNTSRAAVGSCELSESAGITKAIAVFKNFASESVRAQIAVFAACGTQSTRILGAGERLGAVASYQAAFGHLPSTAAEWNDVTKIANGRFTSETSASAEAAAKTRFRSVYLRDANMAQANDKAAIMIMTYGLRPMPRNLNSEGAANLTYHAIFRAGPVTASQWDTVRAIAYSGAKR